MSTLTADPPTTSHAATPPAAAQVQPTFAGVMRGEWIKLLSLRSTWWALASTAAVITLVALAAAVSLNAMATTPPWPRASSRCTAPRSSPAVSTSGC
jgi:ABC-2 type transport system permease protein